jgi:hypothetical protein
MVRLKAFIWYLTGALLVANNAPVIAGSGAGNSPVNASGCYNYVYISGKSNVNEFSFYYNPSPMEGQDFDKARAGSNDFIISIPIREFEPSNPLMFQDFLSLMKESDHPHILISFMKNQFAFPKDGSYNTCPDVLITIAGITRRYKIDCSIAVCSSRYFISGIQTIKLTDFQLTPPSKLHGLVKVSDDILVNFGFILTFTEYNPISALH